MSGNSVFVVERSRGWRGGIPNMMRAEFSRWFRTRLWWIQGLMWSVIIGGIMAPILLNSENPGVEGPTLFCLFVGLFASVAVVIIMQDALVGEKESGTLAWILSKPVSRTAFYLSKLLPNMVGVLVCMLIIPGFVFFLELYFISGISLNLLDFGLGLLVLWVYLVFYLSLTHMLGAFFSHRAPVIGISLAVVFGQQMLFGLLPGLARILPWTIAIPLNNMPNSISGALVSGQVLPDLMPLYVALILIIIFDAVGLLRFNRQEV